jgi:hypothetical protein
MNKTTYYNGETVCLNCGTKVHIAYTKDGNKYLGEVAYASIHGGTFSPAHRCDLYDPQDASLGWQERMISQGAIIVGATVKAVKGRKVAKGTIAEVFWTGRDAFKEGGTSVGLLLENGEKVFTSITNLESTVKVGA